MGAIVSEITSVPIIYSQVCSGTDQRKPVNSPHKGPVMRKKFQFDDVIMEKTLQLFCSYESPRVFLLKVN